jgi:hypothetical protein
MIGGNNWKGKNSMAQNNSRREVAELLERSLARAKALHEDGYRVGDVCGVVVREVEIVLRVSYEVWFFIKAFNYSHSTPATVVDRRSEIEGSRAHNPSSV